MRQRRVKSGPVREPDDDEEFEAAVASAKEKGQAVVAMFTAEWCGPCKKVKPFYVELAGKYTGSVFLMVDCDELSDTAETYKIRAMPTFKVIKAGAEVASLNGLSGGLWTDLNDKLEQLVEKECA